MTDLLAAILIVLGLLLFCALFAATLLFWLIWRIVRGAERSAR